MPENDVLQSHITELRRGSLTLAVLGCLREACYGYALLQALQEKGVSIEANTLYPLLRRLEGQGLLTSEWDTAESRPRKYYRISENGHALFAVLLREWQDMQQLLESIFGKDSENHGQQSD